MSFSVFDKGSNLLPVFCKPYPGELLSSCLTRVSFDLGLNRSLLLRLTGVATATSFSSWIADNLDAPEKYEKLASYINGTAEEIQNATLHYYRNKLYDGSAGQIIPGIWRVKKAKSSFYKSSRPDNILFCPSCLSKPGVPVYFRREWRLSISFVCLECNCYLCENCPHCGKESSNMNKINDVAGFKSVDEYLLTCGNCKGDISKCVAEKAPQHILKMQRDINAMLDQSYNQTVRHSVGYFKVLYHLVKSLVVQRHRNFGSLVQDIPDQIGLDCLYVSQKPAIYCLSLKHQANVFYMATWLLEQSPDRFRLLCNRHCITSAAMLSSFSDAPQWFINEARLLENTEPRGKVNNFDNNQQSHTVCHGYSDDYYFDPQEQYYSSSGQEPEEDENEYKDLYEIITGCGLREEYSLL